MHFTPHQYLILSQNPFTERNGETRKREKAIHSTVDILAKTPGSSFVIPAITASDVLFRLGTLGRLQSPAIIERSFSVSATGDWKGRRGFGEENSIPLSASLVLG